jgi:hypothetical protein
VAAVLDLDVQLLEQSLDALTPFHSNCAIVEFPRSDSSFLRKPVHHIENVPQCQAAEGRENVRNLEEIGGKDRNVRNPGRGFTRIFTDQTKDLNIKNKWAPVERCRRWEGKPRSAQIREDSRPVKPGRNLIHYPCG